MYIYIYIITDQSWRQGTKHAKGCLRSVLSVPALFYGDHHDHNLPLLILTLSIYRVSLSFHV
jgi:hypothetical protein